MSSQRSMDATDDVEGSVKVEIDPNVKVTKSGVVKAGGKGSRRPSLQMQVFDGGIEQTDSASPNEGEYIYTVNYTKSYYYYAKVCLGFDLLCMCFILQLTRRVAKRSP